MARAVVPHPVRHAVRRRVDTLQELRDLPRRLERLETLMLESHDRIHERSRRRWSTVDPDVGLTFGRSLTGDAFIAKAAEAGAFGAGRNVLEIGPGYGRLLDAALRQGAEFERWIGVDISPKNVAYLRERFGHDPRLTFINSDAETVTLDAEVDTILSSLTLKHLYPSFEAALSHNASHLRPSGMIVIDLIEGSRRYFEDDGETYIRWYTRDEVREVFEGGGCEVTRFGLVEHDPDHRRLLVVGQRAAG
jgi:SAM-dependent methyltransferase